jgi:DNA-binding CsgD family transcriptional regulator
LYPQETHHPKGDDRMSVIRSASPRSGTPLPAPPLVGRADELASLIAHLDAAAAGRGSTVVLIGEGGIGKTRLAESLADEAERRGFRVAGGRAFPVEVGVPYALFADAFIPVLRTLDEATIAALARGGEAELAYVLPGVAPAGVRPRPLEDPAELKSRVLFTTAEFVRNLAARKPLLLVLDDVHWADRSSLELLHFLARHTAESKVLVLGTLNETERAQRPELRSFEKSLLSLGVVTLQRVGPLTRAATYELVRRTFNVDEVVISDFADLLFGWTRGNVFFLTETLQTLIESGRLYQRPDGQWLGWELAELELPPTVREVILARLERLSDAARRVADAAAVIGTRFEHELLREVVGLSDAEFVTALDELRNLQIIREVATNDDLRYDFAHPLLRKSLYTELGTARARMLHASVARALETSYGDKVDAHADELAVHFARAGGGDAAPKALHYLVAAGRSALARYADREAVDYLRLALERWRPGDSAPPRGSVMNELARAHQRVGEHDAAIGLWQECLEAASEAGNVEVEAGLRRRLGQACYWSSRHEEALEHYGVGLRLAQQAGRKADEARLRLAAGVCLQELGRADEAKREIGHALAMAEAAGDTELLARAHRALLLLHIWIGPPDAARMHGARAGELARAAGDTGTEFYSEWGLAVLEGLTGHTPPMRRHIAAAEAIAEQQRSPIYRLWTAELEIELASATGDWDRAIAMGEHAIALARSLNQRTLLPRVLVWTSLVYMGRGNLERAKSYVDEAWDVSGADNTGPHDVHTVVPAHTGLAAYHLTTRNFHEAIRIAQKGLAIADRTGYAFWAMHRLLPVMAESYLHLRDVEGAAATEARIRHEAERLGHKVGLAWADTCRALVAWMQGDLVLAATLIREACGSLEAIPVIPDAARLRRQLAGRLAEIGDRDGALHELRIVHDIFLRLGAEDELAKARGMFREVGAKPPARTAAAAGAEGLTGRELEIARMVAARKSNKAIGKALDISPRTVSTHLSNIFRKAGVESRGELADYVREHGL